MSPPLQNTADSPVQPTRPRKPFNKARLEFRDHLESLTNKIGVVIKCKHQEVKALEELLEHTGNGVWSSLWWLAYVRDDYLANFPVLADKLQVPGPWPDWRPLALTMDDAGTGPEQTARPVHPADAFEHAAANYVFLSKALLDDLAILHQKLEAGTWALLRSRGRKGDDRRPVDKLDDRNASGEQAQGGSCGLDCSHHAASKTDDSFGDDVLSDDEFELLEAASAAFTSKALRNKIGIVDEVSMLYARFLGNIGQLDEPYQESWKTLSDFMHQWKNAIAHATVEVPPGAPTVGPHTLMPLPLAGPECWSGCSHVQSQVRLWTQMNAVICLWFSSEPGEYAISRGLRRLWSDFKAADASGFGSVHTTQASGEGVPKLERGE